jgi:diketogulonate reductase-like aldo/keto reductase
MCLIIVKELALCISACVVPSLFPPLTGNRKYRCVAVLSGSLARHPAIVKIAKASGLTPVQTALRFAQLKGMIPLSDSINEIHMQQDVDVENRSLKKEDLGMFWGTVKQILRF